MNRYSFFILSAGGGAIQPGSAIRDTANRLGMQALHLHIDLETAEVPPGPENFWLSLGAGASQKLAEKFPTDPVVQRMLRNRHPPFNNAAGIARLMDVHGDLLKVELARRMVPLAQSQILHLATVINIAGPTSAGVLSSLWGQMEGLRRYVEVQWQTEDTGKHTRVTLPLLLVIAPDPTLRGNTGSVGQAARTVKKLFEQYDGTQEAGPSFKPIVLWEGAQWSKGATLDKVDRATAEAFVRLLTPQGDRDPFEIIDRMTGVCHLQVIHFGGVDCHRGFHKYVMNKDPKRLRLREYPKAIFTLEDEAEAFGEFEQLIGEHGTELPDEKLRSMVDGGPEPGPGDWKFKRTEWRQAERDASEAERVAKGKESGPAEAQEPPLKEPAPTKRIPLPKVPEFLKGPLGGFGTKRSRSDDEKRTKAEEERAQARTLREKADRLRLELARLWIEAVTELRRAQDGLLPQNHRDVKYEINRQTLAPDFLPPGTDSRTARDLLSELGILLDKGPDYHFDFLVNTPPEEPSPGAGGHHQNQRDYMLLVEKLDWIGRLPKHYCSSAEPLKKAFERLQRHRAELRGNVGVTKDPSPEQLEKLRELWSGKSGVRNYLETFYGELCRKEMAGPIKAAPYIVLPILRRAPRSPPQGFLSVSYEAWVNGGLAAVPNPGTMWTNALMDLKESIESRSLAKGWEGEVIALFYCHESIHKHFDFGKLPLLSSDRVEFFPDHYDTAEDSPLAIPPECAWITLVRHPIGPQHLACALELEEALPAFNEVVRQFQGIQVKLKDKYSAKCGQPLELTAFVSDSEGRALAKRLVGFWLPGGQPNVSIRGNGSTVALSTNGSRAAVAETDEQGLAPIKVTHQGPNKTSAKLHAAVLSARPDGSYSEIAEASAQLSWVKAPLAKARPSRTPK